MDADMERNPDVSSLPRAEAELRAQRDFVRRLLDAVADAMVTLDAGGTILSFNKAAERIFGYEPAEIVGKPIDRLIPDHPINALESRRTRITGAVREAEGRRQDGSTFPLELSVGTMEQDGHPLFVAVIRDITLRRQTEQSLRAARLRAEGANRAKSSFLAMMSHEIRTPMNGVIGMTSLLLDTELGPEQRHYAEVIRASAEALLTVINDVLDFSKLEAGKIELETTDFRLAQEIDGVIDILAPRAMAKGIALNARIPAVLRRGVRGDPGRLRQVLLNLVGNAIKFTERGSVDLSVMEEPAGPDGRPVIRFAVHDTGIGIADEDIPRLFQEYTQLEPGTARKYGGTGLGLAICRRLVAIMGGTIGVESRTGVGSTFWFTVPLETAAGQPEIVTAQAPPAATGGPRLNILVAEDNPVSQQVAVGMLGRLGHHADVVATGRAAVEAVRSRLYDLVLMDVRMPDLDGCEATREIRRLPGSNGQVPIVAMTAGALAADRRMCLAAGMNDCVVKPVDRRKLALVVEHWALRPLRTIAGPDPAMAAPKAVDAALEPVTAILVDHKVVDDLRSFLGRDLVAELTAAFRQDARSRLEAIIAANRTGDLITIGQAAHDLGGPAANLGLARLHVLTDRLCEAAHGNDGAAAAALVQDLVQCWIETMALLDAAEDCSEGDQVSANQEDLLQEMV